MTNCMEPCGRRIPMTAERTSQSRQQKKMSYRLIRSETIFLNGTAKNAQTNRHDIHHKEHGIVLRCGIASTLLLPGFDQRGPICVHQLINNLGSIHSGNVRFGVERCSHVVKYSLDKAHLNKMEEEPPNTRRQTNLGLVLGELRRCGHGL